MHVLPYDLARGAQRYARALVDCLDVDDERHLILTLFASEPVLLDPDVRLDVPRGLFRWMGFDPRALARLRSTLRRMAPRAVVAHGGESAKYAAWAMPDGVPLVYYKIGTVHRRLQGLIRRAIHGRYARRADLVATVSRDVAEEANRLLGIPRRKLLVIPNGRDPDIFRPGPDRPSDAPARLLFVGHLDAGKRPEWFLEVVRALRERAVDVEATMVGDGPLEVQLRPGARSAGVTMLGRRDDVPDILASHDVFVFTSLAPGEGMPGVLIEAGLSGLAVVCTEVPGARDVVEHGRTGFVVDVNDLAGLIEAVQHLATDPQLTEAMGRRARERCVELFTLEASAGQWRSILRDLAG